MVQGEGDEGDEPVSRSRRSLSDLSWHTGRRMSHLTYEGDCCLLPKATRYAGELEEGVMMSVANAFT